LARLGSVRFPDSNAHGGGHRPHHVYSVAFDGRELWGAKAPRRDKVHIDLWEDHLEADKPGKDSKRAKTNTNGMRGNRR
jgi:hypothetical protein